jgi:hypothetical protein
MIKLDRLILGSNTFEGVSYVSRSQSLHYLEHFGRPENIVAVLDAAFNLGVKTFTCSYTDNIMQALEAFRHNQEISILPVIPNVYEYARDASEKGILGTLVDRAKRIDMYQKIRFGLRALGKIKSVISKDILSLLIELLDFELAGFKKYRMASVILHGQMTDLALSTHNKNIIDIFQAVIKDNYGLQPILATHNFGTLLPQLVQWDIRIPIMAPLNQKGFMMKPTKEACEKLIRETDYPIVAKKVLAGGRLSPEDGFSYLTDKKTLAVVVGVGSVPEAYHTFAVAKTILKIPPA